MNIATHRARRGDLALLWHQVRYEQLSFWRIPTRAPGAASPIPVALPMPPVPPGTETNYPAISALSAMVHSYTGDLPKAVASR